MASIVGKSLGRFRWPGEAFFDIMLFVVCAANSTSSELTQQGGREENSKSFVYDKRDRAITYKFCPDLYLTLLCLSHMIIVKLVMQGLPSSLFCRPFA